MAHRPGSFVPPPLPGLYTPVFLAGEVCEIAGRYACVEDESYQIELLPGQIFPFCQSCTEGELAAWIRASDIV